MVFIFLNTIKHLRKCFRLNTLGLLKFLIIKNYSVYVCVPFYLFVEVCTLYNYNWTLLYSSQFLFYSDKHEDTQISITVDIDCNSCLCSSLYLYN